MPPKIKTLTPPTLTVVQVIKLFTSVPHKFVDDFFSLYDRKHIGVDEYIVNLDTLSEWIEVPKYTLMKTLKDSYTENIDYIRESIVHPTKKNANHYVHVMITPDCMKRLCMRSRSNKSETVRTYFIEIETFLINYNDQIVNGVMHDIQDLARKNLREKQNDGPGTVYVLRASKELKKFGETGMDMSDRLATYNTGRAKDIEVLQVYRVEYRKEIERCVKKLMKNTQYRARREIYNVDLAIISKLVAGCAQLSMKLHYTSKKSRMDGEYYIIFKTDMPNADKIKL